MFSVGDKVNEHYVRSLQLPPVPAHSPFNTALCSAVLGRKGQIIGLLCSAA